MTASTTSTAASEQRSGHPSVWRRAVRGHRPDAYLGMAWLGLVVVAAIASSVIATHDPNAVDVYATFQGPSKAHWLGTDEAGRDVFSRMVFGARVSILAALEAVSIASVLGVAGGLVAGWRGGWTDRIIGRCCDGIMSIPGIVFALTAVAILGPGIKNGMLAVGIVLVPQFFRIARGTTKALRNETFIESSIALGCSTRRTVLRHVLPNIAGPLIVEITMMLSVAVVVEAALSYLGLGVRPPTSSWGSILASAKRRPDIPHLLYPPGVALVLTVLALSAVGDAVRDRLAGRNRGS